MGKSMMLDFRQDSQELKILSQTAENILQI